MRTPPSPWTPRTMGSCVWGAADWDQVDCCDKNSPYYVGDADALLYCNYDPFAPGAGTETSPFGGGGVQASGGNPFPIPGEGQTGPSLTGPSTSPSISPLAFGLHAFSPSFFQAAGSPGGTVGGVPSRGLFPGGAEPLPPSPAPVGGAVGSFVGQVGTTTVVVLGAGAALLLWWMLK